MNLGNKLRIGIVVLCIVLLIPVLSSALTYEGLHSGNEELRNTTNNVTFVTTQGGSSDIYEHAGVLTAVHTESGEAIWTHDEYRRYMDVQPLDQDRLLFVAGERESGDSFQRVAVVINWRTGEELTKFDVPSDTHDIDHMGGSEYVIADKATPEPAKHRGGRIYIYNESTDEVEWEYVFAEHFPSYPEAGGQATGYTHLNDVDIVDNGSAFLVSPRNFDRVMLINRSTKETEWTLGEENNYDILHEQHNPSLISQDPVTLLVADSENNRVVEYERQSDGSWKLIWSFSEGLHWPRDADRLPNGNTLIVDTANDRVIEVTPDREVVWEFTIERSPYDADRLEYGEEPEGPPMVEFSDQFDSPHDDRGASTARAVKEKFIDSHNRLYSLVGAWVLPLWAGSTDFAFLLGVTGLLSVWAGVEVGMRTPIERLFEHINVDRLGTAAAAMGILAVLSATGLLWISLSQSSFTGIYVGTAVLLLNIGYSSVAEAENWPHTRSARRVDAVFRVGSLLVSFVLGGLFVFLQLSNAGGSLVLYSALALGMIFTALQNVLVVDL
ncbi:aryl-sulfate sulfotransferase [Halostella sp. PRR32]|uniref:aryl-sulfate sulfotransferase n=1 Tax=Halostella sp. PRR32 TaxID=3098147 RepID=UPI002B1D5ACE|nr:aryl-sulfate sulfotransferase [Halostella sp. PRR32]